MTSSGATQADADDVVDIGEEQAIKLEGHDNEVFICAWHPSKDILASGFVDRPVGFVADVCRQQFGRCDGAHLDCWSR